MCMCEWVRTCGGAHPPPHGCMPLQTHAAPTPRRLTRVHFWNKWSPHRGTPHDMLSPMFSPIAKVHGVVQAPGPPPLAPVACTCGRTGSESSTVFKTAGGALLTVTVTEDPEVVARWLCKHTRGTASALPVAVGVDCEWEAGRTTGASLIQLAVSSGHVLLLQTCPACSAGVWKTHQRFVDAMESFLGMGVLKVGCGVSEDVRRIKETFSLSGPLWCVLDLSNLHTLLHRGTGTGRPVSLANLAAYYLRLPSWKLRGVPTSDWSARPLTEAQMTYAAMDAWVSVALLDCMVAHLMA